MIGTWDAILQQGTQLVGAWSSDAHRTEKFGPAKYLDAPSLELDALMKSLYEGRAYMANHDFGGQVIFSLAAAHSEPYPARVCL